jgi:hypothetical protein
MKIMNLSSTAKLCGLVLALLLLSFARPVVAQVDPVSYFVEPPLEQVIRITSPPNHATFYSPVDIPVFAYLHDGYSLLATYTSVEFYASNSTGTIDLGPGTRLSEVPVTGVTLPNIVLSESARFNIFYCRVWTNAPAGAYALRAVATGTKPGGFGPDIPISLARTSAPVNITILASLTNHATPDIVSVVASDPVAIAGTNAFWIWPGETNATPAWTNWPPRQWASFTNWGPKNALFTVRRFGDARTNLTINYSVSGTAVSNVDYVGLPGSVTIPAGAAAALIPVVPLDNSETNVSKSVILALNASTNYLVGFPPRAEVLIMDYWPRPLPLLLADHSFHLNTNGPDGAWFYLQNSSDLLNWSTVSTNQIIHGSIDFLDPDAASNPLRFYRPVPLTNSPTGP